MDLLLNHTNNNINDCNIFIPGSKSESNRLLILKQIFGSLQIKNLSNADDTIILQKALSENKPIINIGHAGTAMRFLTAYYATKKDCDVILTGSERMQKRPIKVLVDALLELGADITYLQEKGFPPLKIKGKEFTKSEVALNGNISSQYISALLLIAPSLKNGLKIKLLNEVTSIPYIEMTLSLLHKIGINTSWQEDYIQVLINNEIVKKSIVVESDWSAASYYYSLVALSNNGKLTLSSFKENSLQGDSALASIYTEFGVETTFGNETIILKKKSDFKQKSHLTFNLKKTPDIAQTIAVTCFGLGISCGLTGLHTLKIKETDRLKALKTELQKLDAKVRITEDSLHLKSPKIKRNTTSTTVEIETYDDHRMAMAFAPLSLKVPLIIKNSEVVSKSYPSFWEDFNRLLS